MMYERVENLKSFCHCRPDPAPFQPQYVSPKFTTPDPKILLEMSRAALMIAFGCKIRTKWGGIFTRSSQYCVAICFRLGYDKSFAQFLK